MFSSTKTLALVDAGSLLSVRQSEVDINLAEIAKNARSQLEYTTLATSLMTSDQVLTSNEKTLLRLLGEHGVKVYSKPDITAYKIAKGDRAILLIPKVLVFWALCLALVGGLVVLIVGALAAAITGSDYAKFVALWGFIAAVVSALAIANNLGPSFLGDWLVKSLTGYTEPVPPEALALATKLIQHQPSISLEVEELVVKYETDLSDQRLLRKKDRLLFVKLDGARFCIAKWDKLNKFNDPLAN